MIDMAVDVDVSSHLPARGGSMMMTSCLSIQRFPVTSPRGEDPLSWVRYSTASRFPVTSPRGEDPGGAEGEVASQRFQSPPREGRI